MKLVLRCIALTLLCTAIHSLVRPAFCRSSLHELTPVRDLVGSRRHPVKRRLHILSTLTRVPQPRSHRVSMSAGGFLDGIFENVQRAQDNFLALNAERLAIKEGSELIGSRTGGVQRLLRTSCEKASDKPSIVAKLMRTEGAVQINNVLSPETSAALREFILQESVRAKAAVESGEVPFDSYFGGVNCRGVEGLFGRRQDMYLPVSEPLVRGALSEIASNLEPLLNELVGPHAMFHEVSCLVADPGAPRQCIHCDTIHLPCPQFPDAHMEPLFTFFVALQDVEDNMGHTQFLPCTQTAKAHELWNVAPEMKERFIAASQAVESQLQNGDTAIFDSRLLHCGRENSSDKTRILFYFTLSSQQRWPLKNGRHGSNSIRAEDRWRYQLSDVLVKAPQV
eukprot:TRINITY_DN74043_c0_g1_i1.p1 TRINITY_DN74043_c0_g1~~TRINITY_DN74043_c0_g1_i1.p1  ORF type:complete len:395 (+),score=38.90 TRINITY_DN74043_c0_g1_i1:42-1226(+)